MSPRCVVAVSAVLAACTTIQTPHNIRRDQGTTTPKSWCDPSRGLPGDPSLGVVRPLKLGIGSIVHERDSTTESFLAARAFRDLVKLPERALDVTVVDHPADADYSVMGIVRGDVSYARQTEMGALGWTSFGVAGAGYMIGGIGLGTAELIDALSSQPNDAIPVIKEISLISLGVAVAGNVYVASRPANRYTWDQTAVLTLRRGTVVIGELEVRDVSDRVRWGTYDEPRSASEAALWRQAAAEVRACIEKDLAGGGQPVAKVEP